MVSINFEISKVILLALATLLFFASPLVLDLFYIPYIANLNRLSQILANVCICCMIIIHVI